MHIWVRGKPWDILTFLYLVNFDDIWYVGDISEKAVYKLNFIQICLNLKVCRPSPPPDCSTSSFSLDLDEICYANLNGWVAFPSLCFLNIRFFKNKFIHIWNRAYMYDYWVCIAWHGETQVIQKYPSIWACIYIVISPFLLINYVYFQQFP